MLAQSSITIPPEKGGDRNGTLDIKMEEWAKMGAL